MECRKCVFKNCLCIDCQFTESDVFETIFSSCKFEGGSLSSTEFHSCDFITPIFSDVGLAFTTIKDSKFSKFNKSIKFEGEFILDQIVSPKMGISEIFYEDRY